jgi:hypothetical protein
MKGLEKMLVVIQTMKAFKLNTVFIQYYYLPYKQAHDAIKQFLKSNYNEIDTHGAYAVVMKIYHGISIKRS